MTALFLDILRQSVSASYVVVLVVALRLMLRRSPKWVHGALWALVALRLLCPSFPQSSLSLVPEISVQDTVLELSTLQTPLVTFDASRSLDYDVLMTPQAPDLLTKAGWVWLGGVAVMGLYMVLSVVLLRRQVATAVRLQGNLFQSDRVDSPFVLGLFFPKIYLPFDLSPEDTPYVIAHEQAHIRRMDHWWKPLGFGLLSLHWFNPLLWLGYVLLCRDMELACDERVIRRLGSQNRADYTQSLVHCSVRRHGLSACPLAFGEVRVKSRVRAVLHYRNPSRLIWLLTLLLTAMALVCSLTNPVTAEEEYVTSALRLDVDGDGQTEFCTVRWDHSKGKYATAGITVREGGWDGSVIHQAYREMPSNNVQFYQEGTDFGIQCDMRDGVRVRYRVALEDGAMVVSTPSRYPAWSLDYGFTNITSTGLVLCCTRWGGNSDVRVTTDGSYALEREVFGEFHPVEPIAAPPEDGTVYEILHKQETAMVLNWEHLYGPLERGHYYLTKTFTQQNQAGIQKEFVLRMLFSIGEP